MLSKLPRPSAFSWPARRVKTKTPAQQAAPGPVGAPHTFKKVGPSRWQCSGCLRRTSVWGGPLFQAPCGEVSIAIRRVAESMQAHRLWVAVLGRGPRTIVFCIKCGGYFTTEPKGLQRAACGAPGGAGRRTLNRIQRGLHPDPLATSRVGKPWPLLEEQTEEPP